ncbi:NBS-LRR type disease resistance protein [Quillaja saponaria]|uniref:NBS-LRR type disease resistance protein n=1 Tax=Quillaja saponaria TaxID=32244 RepID=A0AAD7L2X1_QUISA|nr:NBS-LRR type disease resistance protein [Quillaja saponaria]
MLENLFPPSIAKGLEQLEDIVVRSCGLEFLVAQDAKPEEQPSIVGFEFPRLISLTLSRLPKLRGCYPGRHSVEWPMLRNLVVFRCDSLEIFRSENESSKETFRNSQLEDTIDGQQPLISIEKVVPNLKKMAVNGKDITKLCHDQSRPDLFRKIEILHLLCFFEDQSILFPFTFLKRIPNLNTLIVGWSDFKVLFPSEELDKDCTLTLQKLRSLTLESLDNFECIWDGDSTLPNILENLEYLQLRKCSSLIKLAFFSISLRNLKSLEVSDCRGLMNLMTFPIAKSLINLETMKIINCESMEEIVANEEDEKGIVNHEIVFEKLETLQLDSLPRLTSFCRGSNCALNFPALELVIVTQCPVMTTFSPGVIRAPLLKVIYQIEGVDKRYWNADLNTIIDMIFKETVNKKKDKEKKGVREGVQKDETEDATTKEEEKGEEGAMKKAEEGMWTEEKGAEEDGKEEEGKVDDTETKEEGKKLAEETQVDDKGGHKGNEGDQNKKPDSPSQNLDELKSNKRKGMVPSTSEPSKLDKNKETKIIPSLSKLPSTAPSSVGVDLSFTWQPSQASYTSSNTDEFIGATDVAGPVTSTTEAKATNTTDLVTLSTSIMEVGVPQNLSHETAKTISCGEIASSSSTQAFIPYTSVDNTSPVLTQVTAVLTPIPTMHTESPTPAVQPQSSVNSHLLPTGSSIQMAATIPSTPITDMAMFRGLGLLHKKFIPLLEEAMSKHPELWTRRPQEYSNEFSLWGFHALGRVLEFLRTVRIRDITSERKREFSRLWLELGAFGFDLTWLEPSYRKVMTCSVDEPKIKRFEELKGEVISLAKDLREKVVVVEDKLVKVMTELTKDLREKVVVVEDKLVKVMTELTEASKNLTNPDYVIDF